MPSAWHLSRRQCALAVFGAGLWLLALAPSANAQAQVIHGKRGVTIQHAVVNFAELARQEKLHPPAPAKKRAIPIMRAPKPPLPTGVLPAAPPFQAAVPTVSPDAPRPLSPPLATTLAGAPDNLQNIPPDTQGAAGPTH